MCLRFRAHELFLFGVITGGFYVMLHGQASLKSEPADFDHVFQQVSNWGHWGKNDQRGAINLITSDKQREAAALVKAGISVSMEFYPAPAELAQQSEPDYSRLDALCHSHYKGQMYNGLALEMARHTYGGAAGGPNPRCSSYLAGVGVLGLDSLQSGIFTRGILIDIPGLKGITALEPGRAITIQDLEDWQKSAGIQVMPGDAVFLRTGRRARRTNGADPRQAGYDWTAAPWFKSRDVAFFGSDGSLDARPQPVAVAGVDAPFRVLAQVAMGAQVIEGTDLEGVAQLARKLKRWDFLVTAAPNTITGGSTFPINVVATF